ncbi:MAG TPA: type II toxin-antitoxin system RelE/ParE family toxin [Stellaceae bacterium]
MGPGRWKARLSAAAERDFLSILEWTRERFSVRQSQTYRTILQESIRALRDGPDVPGARRPIDIAPGVWSLHIARGRRRGRHLLLYRVAGERTLEIIRILHDSMDPVRHLPEPREDR